MKTVSNRCFLLLLCAMVQLSTVEVPAQEVVATSGAYAETEQGSLDWTIGEPVIAMGIADGSILSQGYHQPFLMITSVEGVDRKKLALNLYPNPSHALLNIELKEMSGDDFEAVLFHPDGKILKRQRLNFQTLHTIDLRSLPAGTYQLSVFQNRILQESFSVIKL